MSACETNEKTQKPEMTSLSTLPDSFTSDNIMKIHQGMSSEQIVKLFGKPKNISQNVCGSNTKKTWTCTTWEYGKFPYDRANFTFMGDSPDSLILNNFDIQKQ